MNTAVNQWVKSISDIRGGKKAVSPNRIWRPTHQLRGEYGTLGVLPEAVRQRAPGPLPSSHPSLLLPPRRCISHWPRLRPLPQEGLPHARLPPDPSRTPPDVSLPSSASSARSPSGCLPTSTRSAPIHERMLNLSKRPLNSEAIVDVNVTGSDDPVLVYAPGFTTPASFD